MNERESLVPIVEALHLCVWERCGPGQFRALGRKPAALVAAFPELSATVVDLGTLSPVLAHFLDEAEAHWRSGAPHAISSGPWSDATANGPPLPLETIAINCAGVAYLVIQILGTPHAELTRILQSAREGSLAYEHLEKTERALRASEARFRELSNELERRVRERTAELRSEIEQHLHTQEQLLRHQEDLRTLTDELLLAEERERRRLAAGLHDEVGQTLAVAKIRLGALMEAIADADRRGEVEAIRSLLDDSIQHTRSLTFELVSPLLHEAGLVSALASLAEQIERQHAIRVRFEDDGADKPLPNNTSVLVYRAVRELLHNVVKHAHATAIEMKSARVGALLALSLRDNGQGFEVPVGHRRSATGGFGLFNVRERLEHLGGRVDIESTRGAGTTVTLHVPIVGGNPVTAS
ncbi:MAG: ATP-binding protein [Planctomycetota bacterium]